MCLIPYVEASRLEVTGAVRTSGTLDQTFDLYWSKYLQVGIVGNPFVPDIGVNSLQQLFFV